MLIFMDIGSESVSLVSHALVADHKLTENTVHACIDMINCLADDRWRMFSGGSEECLLSIWRRPDEESEGAAACPLTFNCIRV